MTYDEKAELWNNPLIGSVWLPGKCLLSIEGGGRDIDQQKQKGSNKAYSEDNGENLVTGSILVQIPSIDCPEYEMWVAVAALLDPNSPSASTGPQEIIHPATELKGVKAIRIQQITYPAPSAKDGFNPRVKWIEYAEKPKEVKKASTKKSENVSTLDRQQPLIQPIGPAKAPGLSGMDAFDNAMAGYK